MVLKGRRFSTIMIQAKLRAELADFQHCTSRTVAQLLDSLFEFPRRQPYMENID
jgi:hypothetical protein